MSTDLDGNCDGPCAVTFVKEVAKALCRSPMEINMRLHLCCLFALSFIASNTSAALQAADVLPPVFLGQHEQMRAAQDGSIATLQYRLPYANGTTVYVTQDSATHDGAIDMVGQSGKTIVAAADGWIRDLVQHHNACCCSSVCIPCNNYVVMEHANNEWTKYLHIAQNSAQVSIGQYITAGTSLATEGDVGYTCSSGSGSRPPVPCNGSSGGTHNCARHLHFELRIGGRFGTYENPDFCNIGYVAQGQTYTASACTTGRTSFSMYVINSRTGAAVSGAYVTWGAFSTTTDNQGRFSFADVPCGTNTLRITKVGYLPYEESFTPPCNGSSNENRGCAPDMPCSGGSLAADEAAPRFQIGDTIQVAGTGIGLRAWQNTCTGTYDVKPDGSVGAIQEGPLCCGGHLRWRIRYAGDNVDRWSAEGNPDTGEFWLHRITTTHTVSGTVTVGGSGLSGVQMQGLSGNPTTDANGFYSANVAAGSSLAVTPVKAGYAFTPPSRSYSSLASNQSNQNYTGTANPTSFQIEGTLYLGAYPYTGQVLLNLAPSVPGSPFATQTGLYQVTVPPGWSGSITPSAVGYTFVPPSRSYPAVNSNLSSENFDMNFIPPEDTTLTVTLQPQAAIDAGAGWRVWWYLNGSARAWEANFRPSGETAYLDSVTADQIRVEFNSIEDKNWNTPSDQWFDFVQGSHQALVGEYTPMVGAVTATIEPPGARAAGAQWRVNGGLWRNSAFTETTVPIGLRTVEFKPVSGWIHPANRIVSVTNFGSVNISDWYIDQGAGPLIVSVSPNSGPLEGGTELTIGGANFATPAQVTFGGLPAAQLTVVNATEIRAKTPARSTVASVDVAVTVADTTAIKPHAFTYVRGAGQNMHLLGQIGGAVNAVAVQGNYAYLGVGPNLLVLDVSLPSNPLKVSSVLLDGVVKDIAVSGTRAYVAADDRGLYILDISAPAGPALIGVYDTIGNAQKVMELGGLVYLTDYNEGLLVLDVSHPAQPALLGSVAGFGRAKGMDIVIRPDGLFAYITTDFDQRLHVIDASIPYSPILRGNIHVGEDATGVAVAWPLAYVAVRFGGVMPVIDVTNPDLLSQVRQVQSGVLVEDTRIVGNRLYIGGAFALRIYSISDPLNPMLLTTYGDVASVQDIAVKGTTAFLAERVGGLTILSVSNPSSLSVLSVYDPISMHARRIKVENNLAYVAATGLRLFDITNPAAPSLAGVFDCGDMADLAVRNSLAYLAFSGGGGSEPVGLQIVDATNPINVLPRGAITGSLFGATAVSGSFLWVGGAELTTFHGVLRAYGLNNPDAPTFHGELELGEGSWTWSIVERNGRVYCADANNGLYIVSASAPPVVQSFVPLDSGANAVAIWGQRAYVAETNGLVRVLDVSDATSPTLLPIAGLSDAFYLTAADGLLYMGRGFQGVSVYDVSDPDIDPRQVGSYDTAGSATGIEAIDGEVYVADGSGGLVILVLRDYTPPTVTITNPTVLPTFITNMPTINLGGAAMDDSGVVQVTWVNHRGGSGSASGTTSWTVASIALYPGENIITVTAFDAESNVGSDVITVTYNPPPDVDPPVVTITFPTLLGIYSTGASTIALGGAAIDDRDVAQVTWSNSRGGSGNAVGTEDWSIDDIPLLAGTNVLTVTAFDAANNMGDAVLDVTVIDQDGDGVADADDMCPNTIPGAPVDVDGCPPHIPGDLDRDGDVDLVDWVQLYGCLFGPSTPVTDPGCTIADLIGSGFVDLRSVGGFQRCFSNANVPAAPSCGN